MTKKIVTSVFLAGLLVLAGCGGGGDSSADSSTGLSFPSNAVLAAPTLENGVLVEETVATNQSDSVPLLNGVGVSPQVNTALLSNEVSSAISKHIKDMNFNTYSLNETVNETFDCSYGGTYHVSGSGAQNSDVALNMTYSQCDEGGSIMNGSMYATLTNYDANIDDYKNIYVKFTSDMTMTMNASSTKVSKNSYIDMSILTFDNYGSMATYKLTMSLQVTNGVYSFGQQNSVYYFTTDGYNIEMYQTQGRIYIDNLNSYVDYDTSYDMSQTPFVFTGSGLTSGEARYNMSDVGKVKIIVESNNPITYVDADGDGTYELSENSIN